MKKLFLSKITALFMAFILTLSSMGLVITASASDTKWTYDEDTDNYYTTLDDEDYLFYKPKNDFPINIMFFKNHDITFRSTYRFYGEEYYTVWYSTKENGKYKKLKTTTDEDKWIYNSNKLEFGKSYYVYMTMKADGKTYRSDTVKLNVPGFDNIDLKAENSDYGLVKLKWKGFLTPESVSIYYSESKNGKYKGYKNVKYKDFVYIMGGLDDKKTYYFKAVMTYKGKSYTSDIVSLKTKKYSGKTVTKGSDVNNVVNYAIQQGQTKFSALYKKPSLYLDSSDMMKKFKCFTNVHAKKFKKADGSIVAIYDVQYKDYPNIISACVTRDSSFLKKNPKKNYNIAIKIIDSVIKDNMSDKEKIKAIHDYIIEHNEYDYDTYIIGPIHNGGRGYTLSGVLQDGTSVCNGYAETFKLFMDILGINCVFVSGTANNDTGGGFEGHAWDMVELNGKWYHVDVTWDDHKSQEYRYIYYLITDSKISDDHEWDRDEYPKADNSTIYKEKEIKSYIENGQRGKYSIYLDDNDYIHYHGENDFYSEDYCMGWDWETTYYLDA